LNITTFSGLKSKYDLILKITAISMPVLYFIDIQCVGNESLAGMYGFDTVKCAGTGNDR